MKPDKLDIKIQEAAAHNNPAYNELAWSNMEKLLDKEMPQQKKDRKRIFWLFLFLFFGTGVLLLITHPWKDKGDAVVSVKRNSTIAPANIRNSASAELTNKIIGNTGKDTIPFLQAPIIETIYSKIFPEKTIKYKEAQKIITDEAGRNDEVIAYRLSDATEKHRKADQQIMNSEKMERAKQPDNLQSVIETIKKDSVEVNENENKNANEKNNFLIKENNKKTSGKKITTPKKSNKFNNSFALNFSAGPDVSAVNMDNIGKINLAYGAGISYQLGKRFTLRTGFYFEKKRYDAKASDYHPPTMFWSYYPDLNYIEADCKVYEVPLILNYNFSQTPKHLWFGSAGLSSYFMKKEDYGYFSKTPSGQNSYNSYSITNKNQHYLSSIRLSAGYEKRLGNTISIIAEPYLNLPLNGVGYGKVKLYGTGILFTVSVKPLAKK